MSADPHAGQPVAHLGPPLGADSTVMIAVHGRNASPASILELAPQLARPALTYLAPAAAGNTWYPFSFMAPFERNEPYLTSALRRLDSLVAQVTAVGVPSERIAFIGFSQGACLASEFVCRNPRRYGGLIVFSGALIGPPGTTWPATGRLDGVPVFLGCSDIDAHIPRERVEESEQVFRRMGADVTARIYPGMGHIVIADEIQAAQAILDRMLTASPVDR